MDEREKQKAATFIAAFDLRIGLFGFLKEEKR